MCIGSLIASTRKETVTIPAQTYVCLSVCHTCITIHHASLGATLHNVCLRKGPLNPIFSPSFVANAFQKKRTKTQEDYKVFQQMINSSKSVLLGLSTSIRSHKTLNKLESADFTEFLFFTMSLFENMPVEAPEKGLAQSQSYIQSSLGFYSKKKSTSIHLIQVMSFYLILMLFNPHASEYEFCKFSLSFFCFTPSTSSKL